MHPRAFFEQVVLRSLVAREVGCVSCEGIITHNMGTGMYHYPSSLNQAVLQSFENFSIYIKLLKKYFPSINTCKRFILYASIIKITVWQWYWSKTT